MTQLRFKWPEGFMQERIISRLSGGNFGRNKSNIKQSKIHLEVTLE